MKNDFIEPWQKMMDEWQNTQTSMTQQLIDNMQTWNQNFEKSDNSFYSNNPILDIYQSFIQKLLDHNPQYNLHSSNDWHDVLSAFPSSEALVQQMNELIKGSKDIFDKLKTDFIETLPNDDTKDYFLKTLEDISNPYSWLKFSSTDFDEGVKRFSEGPLFSGVSDFDNRIAKAMDGWLDLGEKSNDYYEVLLQNWIKAYEKFLSQLADLNNADKKLSPRELIELWSSIANDELLVMHRSDEFLQAQKALLKAGSQYRLYEQDIAEVICDALHVPTRKEIDDVHKTVTELRREVRGLKQQISDLNSPPTKAKTTTKKKTTATSKATNSRKTTKTAK